MQFLPFLSTSWVILHVNVGREREASSIHKNRFTHVCRVWHCDEHERYNTEMKTFNYRLFVVFLCVVSVRAHRFLFGSLVLLVVTCIRPFACYSFWMRCNSHILTGWGAKDSNDRITQNSKYAKHCYTQGTPNTCHGLGHGYEKSITQEHLHRQKHTILTFHPSISSNVRFWY